MTSPNTSRRTVLVYAVCAALPLIAAGACWYQWRELAGIRMSQPPAAGRLAAAAQPGQAMAQLAQEREALHRNVAVLSARVSTMSRRQMPQDPGSVRRLVLEVLALAQRCGLTVAEVNRTGEEGRGPAGAAFGDEPGGGAAAFLNRFSRGGRPRPLLQIRARADYAAISRFFAGLDGLTWAVTPALFEIVRDRDTRADRDDAPAPPETDGALRLNVIVAL